MIAVDVFLVVMALPVLFWTGYLFLLALAAREEEAPAYGVPRLKFDFVVPAHNEEAGIAETVKSLRAVDYPERFYRVLVVADNCRDQTAEKAREAGAIVLVRNDSKRRGKGYALAHAFELALRDRIADAVVVIDADTTVSPNLLKAFAARIEAGAHAVQAEYAVRNPNASWRTRLMVVALALFHGVRSHARERFHVSAGLRGNGMAFSRQLLEEVPHDAFSLVEDLEYGIRLGLAGHRVYYAGEARVYGEMVSTEEAARSQRRRWEGGRLEIARAHARELIAKGFRQRDPILLDLAADVLVPPLTYIFLATAVGFFVSVAWSMHFSAVAAYAWGLALYFVLFYVARGWVLSGTGVRGLTALAHAPVFIVWKLGLALTRPRHAKGEWVRTTRETNGSKPDGDGKRSSLVEKS